MSIGETMALDVAVLSIVGIGVIMSLFVLAGLISLVFFEGRPVELTDRKIQKMIEDKLNDNSNNNESGRTGGESTGVGKH